MVATELPPLAIAILKVNTSPTFTGAPFASTTVLSIDKSAVCGVMVKVSSSSSSPLPSPSSSTVSSVVGSLSGSYWSLAVICAEFVYSPTAPVGALTVA